MTAENEHLSLTTIGPYDSGAADERAVQVAATQEAPQMFVAAAQSSNENSTDSPGSGTALAALGVGASESTIRFATFNASLNRSAAGQLITHLSTPDNAQAKTIAETIQLTNPDVVLINEFDFDAAGQAADLFQQNYLSISQNGAAPVEYPYVYNAPSNTGIASGFDLDNNGSIGGGNDAFGFGNYPGQFGMLLLSKYPIVADQVRTFQNFLWKDMPDALLPNNPATPAPQDWYSPAELDVFRLSSKSHWDVPIEVAGEVIHVLASHPTPPVFDGPEDRNGTRNHDEIRFWSDYVTPGKGTYIYDDNGKPGALPAQSRFVLMGDMNADPNDGDSTSDAIEQLLQNPYFNTSVTPESLGGPDAASRNGGANLSHTGDPRFDTADFADTTPGNLRADYVLPSSNLGIRDAQVFWPISTDPLFRLAGNFPFPSSDHRLVWVDVATPAARKTVSGIDFLGEDTFATGTLFAGTTVGGLSGIVYDEATGTYHTISDDRSQINPARYYDLTIDLADGSLDDGDVVFTGVTTLLNAGGDAFPALSLDPEGIALSADGTIYVSSEGDANALINPFINEFELGGQQIAALPIANKFLPTAGPFGIRQNLAFESLTTTPDHRFLYTATENALKQDGPAATLADESMSRIVKYDLATGQAIAEFVYPTDTVAAEPIPSGGFSTNGLVELLALDNNGTLLALERSFSSGVGNAIKLYEVHTQGAVDVSSVDALFDVEADPPVTKRLLLDFADLGITLDNLEGLSFGPDQSDGRRTLIVVSDNNFSGTQFTQFLAFALDVECFTEVLPTYETPEVINADPLPEGAVPGDADDPAIYVHPNDASQNFIIGALKDGGLQTYDLQGNVLQTILPGEPGDVRYNNVDVIYGFDLGGESVDLAVATDRENDTLAIFRIDPATRQLTDVTAPEIPASIFGIDDGSQTAYGLATYTSLLDGTQYAFVTQRDGNLIAQLELTDNGSGLVTADVIRTLALPFDGDVEDAQSEAMVVDRETGYLYIAQEETGIWKFHAEPTSGDAGKLIHPVGEELTADAEGLTIYYTANGRGYLLASSQGDSSIAVYEREGANVYLGSFVVGAFAGIDASEETDGTDVINVPSPQFPFGMLVVHDGSNEPQYLFNDDGELENASSNFKFVGWEKVATALPHFLTVDTMSFDPRSPQSHTLPNGVASGDTDADSTWLWTRSLMVGDVTFDVATDASFSIIVDTQLASVFDPLVPVKTQVSGLEPGTQYYYRAIDAAGTTATGSFRTAADQTTYNGLKFGTSGDWRGELAPYPAVSNAVDADLDFFVALGDTIYADYASPAVPLNQAMTLEEYRQKNGEVYDSRHGLNVLGDLRASTSFFATIDDHEVINDFAGGALVEGEGVNDSLLYENGLQAFQEYNPIADEFYGDVALGDNRMDFERKLYRSNLHGRDAATFVLDARSFRDAELPPANLANPIPFLANSFDPTRTMLGEQQIADLKADLLEAQAAGVTWKFIFVPEPIQNLGVIGASDRFEGYAAERTEILKFINDNGITNAVFVAADIHGTLVNNLSYQTGVGQPQIPTSAFEITTGAVAFDAPFGPTVIDIGLKAGLIDQATKSLYEAAPLPVKEQIIQGLINNAIAPLGYDPIGLDGSPVNATLLSGAYSATSTYGWTEFDISAETQQLRVTTYGILPYTADELAAGTPEVIQRKPFVVSEFVVTPQLLSNADLVDTTLILNGGNADDTITIIPNRRGDMIDVRSSTAGLLGTFPTDAIEVIKAYGFGGNDRITVDQRITLPTLLRGGDGHDTILGGSGDDAILGGLGNDLLSGRKGSDLLIGGGGLDVVKGGLGDDILIGGSTAYDNNDDELLAILAAWTSPGSYFQRVNRLRNGIGGPPLNAATVADDGVKDILFGEENLDWYFQGISDQIIGKLPVEQLN